VCVLVVLALSMTYQSSRKEVVLRPPSLLSQKSHSHSHSHSKDKKSPDSENSIINNSGIQNVRNRNRKINNNSTFSSALLGITCEPPYPGYPYCEDKVNELSRTWNQNSEQMKYYINQGVDGTKCSFLNYLNTHGFYCPEAADYAKEKIRGLFLSFNEYFNYFYQ